MKWIPYKAILAAASVSLLIFLVMSAMGRITHAGFFAISFFILLALGFSVHEHLKRFSFTLMIFAAVTTSLYFPGYFTSWNGFKLTGLITPLIQVIMFGMGTTMSMKDFREVIRSPKGVIIGVISQFTIMPTLGFILAHLSGFPPEIAAGIVLIGCSPSGLASNVMSYLAKANVALSITITSVTTLLAPFITPVLMKILAGALVDIQVLEMMKDISKMILLPIGAGVIVHKLFSGHSDWLQKILPKISMLGIALIIVVITAAGRDSLLEIGPLLIILVLTHNIFGYTLGYWFARAFKMEERDCRTVAIEVGMQNGGLASGIAKEMGKIATVGLAAAVFGPMMNITGSILASYWKGKEPA